MYLFIEWLLNRLVVKQEVATEIDIMTVIDTVAAVVAVVTITISKYQNQFKNATKTVFFFQIQNLFKKKNFHSAWIVLSYRFLFIKRFWLYISKKRSKNSRSSSRYGPPLRTEYRLIVENLSSRVSWQVCVWSTNNNFVFVFVLFIVCSLCFRVCSVKENKGIEFVFIF